MAKTELIRVNRNTAVMAGKILENPAAALMQDNVVDGSYLFSFNPSELDNEPLVFACEDEASRDWLQHIEEPFLMHHWGCKRVRIINPETKEAQTQVRTVLIDPNGETLAFVSAGVVMSLDLIRNLRGDGPYDPPIPIIVRKLETRMGYNLFKLQIKSKVVPVKPAK